MANIEINSEYGFSFIEGKISNLTNDIATMIERKEISNEAAKYLLNEFKNIAGICKDYAEAERDKTESKPISLM